LYRAFIKSAIWIDIQKPILVFQNYTNKKLRRRAVLPFPVAKRMNISNPKMKNNCFYDRMNKQKPKLYAGTGERSMMEWPMPLVVNRFYKKYWVLDCSASKK